MRHPFINENIVKSSLNQNGGISVFVIFFLFILGGFIVVLGAHEMRNLTKDALTAQVSTTPVISEDVLVSTTTKATNLRLATTTEKSRHSDKKTRTQLVKIGNRVFTLEIADDEASRSLGLGGRKHMGPHDGMIFVFDKPDRYGFWMKDTFLALDMIWINKNFEIISEKKGVLPESYPEVFYPTEKALYTIEFSAGVLEKMNIKIGDKIFFVE